jgi:hypothetical protein
VRPPKIIKPYVVSFCRSIVAEPQPIYVPVRTVPGAPKDDCFSIVPQHISRHGGEQIIGWTIWEWPRVYIEAEFHTVWQQPDGTVVDLTPKIVPMPRILFLPDPRRSYKGRQVDNIRKPLNHDPAIKRFCELATLMHDEQNRGDLADYHGPIMFTERMQRIDTERQQLGLLLQRRYGINAPEPLT